MRITQRVLVLLAIVLSLSLLLSGAAFAQTSWPDLTQPILDDYDLTNAEVAAISDGYTDGLWRPYHPMPRKHLVKMAVEAFDVPLANPATPSFTDVSPDNIFYQYIEGARQAGLVIGVGGGLFEPDRIISREEAAAIIVRWKAAELDIELAGMTEAEVSALLGRTVESILAPFTDEDDIGPNLREEMAVAIAGEVVLGRVDGSLLPKAALLRIQGAAMLIRALDLDFPMPVPTVSLSPASETNVVGTEHTVTASLSGGASAGNFLFSYQVTGDNTVAASTPTLGQTSFTYTGANPGTDTITVRVFTAANPTTPVATATATKTWAVGVSLSPATATNVVGTEHTVTAALAGGLVAGDYAFSYEVTGDNPQAATAPAAGDTSFAYTGTNIGTDTITVTVYAAANTATPLATATATKTWTAVPPPVQILECAYSLDGGTTWLTGDPASVPGGTGIDFRMQLADSTGTPLASTDVSTSTPLKLHWDASLASGPGSAADPFEDLPDTMTTDEQGYLYWQDATFDLSGVPGGQSREVLLLLDDNANGLWDSGEQACPDPADPFTFNWPLTVTLTPAVSTNELGTELLLTASLPGGLDVGDFLFSYQVTGANPLDETAPVLGESTFSYTGSNLGTDTIQVNVYEAGDPATVVASVTATASWTEIVQILSCEYTVDDGATWSSDDPFVLPAGTPVHWRMLLADEAGTPLANTDVGLSKPLKIHWNPESLTGPVSLADPIWDQPNSTTTDADGYIYWNDANHDHSGVPAGQTRSVLLFFDWNANNEWDAGEPVCGDPTDPFTLSFTAP